MHGLHREAPRPMIKYCAYDGAGIASIEIDGTPYADMEGILTSVVTGAWDDYVQVLNSSDDMQFDLGIKYVQDWYWIPVENISAWLFSFSIRNMRGEQYDRFRIYRRDIEKVFRVVWALPVENLVMSNYEAPWYDHDSDHSVYSLHSVFSAFGVPDEDLKDIDIEGRIYGPLHYIEYICGSSYCGPRGHLVAAMVQYLESLPDGDRIFSHINDMLSNSIPPMTEYLDEYLDELNIFISGETSRFVGEL